jgi:hypothetical protein
VASASSGSSLSRKHKVLTSVELIGPSRCAPSINWKLSGCLVFRLWTNVRMSDWGLPGNESAGAGG